MLERIEIDPRRCGGTPVINGTRIPVAVVLRQSADHETWQSVLQGYPELSREDISAVLIFGKASVEHTEIIPADTE